MASKNQAVRELFIAKIKPFKRVEPVKGMSSVYTTFNEVLLDVRFSALLKSNYFWFFFDTHRLNKWRDKQRFVECCICGSEETVLLIPDTKVFEWFRDVPPNRKGHWLATVVPNEGRLMIKVGHGISDINGSQYLNRLDLISPLLPPPAAEGKLQPRPADQRAFETIRSAILSDQSLSGDSLHERAIDMLAKIGVWSGYDSAKSYAVEAKSPYVIDVVWLKSGEIDVAIEVHDGGNETEAKDRLRQALRFGARKVVIVSAPGAVSRLKNICKFEADLRNWLEVWGIPRIYRMYIAGQDFFRDFSTFNKRQHSDDVSEFL